MNFSEWNGLSAEERKDIKWHRRPHIKTATLFTIVMCLFGFLFIFGIGKNQTSHLNSKPNKEQAYSMAKDFVKDQLKLPASAVFPENESETKIDTASNTYALSGTVKTQSTNGHFIKQNWETRLKFTGGDWASRKSWVVEEVRVQ